MLVLTNTRHQQWITNDWISQIQSGKQKSHLDGTVVAASAYELGPSAGRVAGVNKGGVALETLDPLPCLTVPHTHGLVCARREEHAKNTEEKKISRQLFWDNQLIGPLPNN